MHDLPHCLDLVVTVARQVGQKILPFMSWGRDRLQIRYKRDKTLLTAADLSASRRVVQALTAIFPNIPVLSEEGKLENYAVRTAWQRYWLVDPLDGTRGFVNGLKEFTVNIALIEHGVAVMGVIYAPALDLCYYGAQGLGAFKQVNNEAPQESISSRALDWSDYRISLGRYVSNRNFLHACRELPGCRVLHKNSSLKLCLLAEGRSDIYPRLGRTGEWDTAAGQCILEQAGGGIFDLEGQPLRYNTKVSLINPSFIALGDLTQKERIIELIIETRKQYDKTR